MSKKKYDAQKENQEYDFEMVLLKTVSNNYELDLMKDLLDEHKIPYIIKDRGVGGYMRIISGDSIYGTDILVEESVIERAESLINDFPWEDL